MAQTYTVLQVSDNAGRVAIKAAGCTHAIVSANWIDIQPTATGSVDATIMAQINAAYDHCATIGLKVIFAVGLQYPPSWALSGIEQFQDQAGFNYAETSTSNGKAVRNWIWTATGRTYLLDLWTRMAAAMGSTRIVQTDGVRLGGGWFGELHYPDKYTGSTAGTYAWQGYSASMQAGTDLAADQVICPNPGYVPYTGTDAQDSQWLNWYLNGLVTFGMWQINQFKALGFTRNLYMLLPGYGVRLNQTRTGAGYKQAAALGEDHTRMISAMMHEPAAWPYCTWMNTSDGFPGGTVDSDKSAWKSVREKSRIRGKHYNLIGENTGGESNTGMDNIFSGALANTAYSGRPDTPAGGHDYAGIAWLSYPDLLAGGAKATLANYTTDIAANP